MSVSGGEGGGYTGALYRGLAKSFEEKIKTNTPVVKIDQSGDVVEVYTTNGQVIYARSVIVTVPLGVLKKSSIEFVPPLNDAKLEAIDLIGMGNMNKVLMYWDMTTQDVSWWPEGKVDMQLITDQDSDSEDWTYFYNDHSHVGNEDYHAMTSWNAGDAADRLEKNTDEETMDIVLGNLRKMFGNDVPSPSKYIITRWRSEEFSGGAYSFDTVGSDLTDYRKTLGEPMNNVFFAGEATDIDGWFGTAVAAYTTGVKAAGEIDDSGILDMPLPDFQPTCTRMHGRCGEEFDEACCSGMSCVLEDRMAPIPTFTSLEGSINTITTTMIWICSPSQKKETERNRFGSISRISRTGHRFSGSGSD